SWSTVEAVATAAKTPRRRLLIDCLFANGLSCDQIADLTVLRRSLANDGKHLSNLVPNALADQLPAESTKHIVKAFGRGTKRLRSGAYSEPSDEQVRDQTCGDELCFHQIADAAHRKDRVTKTSNHQIRHQRQCICLHTDGGPQAELPKPVFHQKP